MAKTKITITIDEKYVSDLDRISRVKRANRSALIEQAIKFWEKEQIRNALKHGYQIMAKEDSTAAEEYIKIAQEILSE
jgi:metal-responsive CopG/Arc/MetJ family transcriptional regulator